jgi:hypothetical protein
MIPNREGNHIKGWRCTVCKTVNYPSKNRFVFDFASKGAFLLTKAKIDALRNALTDSD